MFLRKILSALVLTAALPLGMLSCDLFNSFSGGDGRNNPVSHFSLGANALTVAVGYFDTVAVRCRPETEQAGLDISLDYDGDIIGVIPDNFSITVYGKKPGAATLKASINGYSSLCAVTVTGSEIPSAVTPYVYSNASFVSLAPDGGQYRVAASLAGGTPNDVSGFSFEAEQPGIVSIAAEGNVAWLRGVSPGITRVTVRHSRSSFPYSFIASCGADNVSFPYITTESNVVTLNKALAKEASFSVGMANPNSFIYDSDYSFSVLDRNFNADNDPPVSISANGKGCVVTPLKSGECYVRVTHKSPDVFYPLDVLVIVYEQIDNVYIDIPEPVVYASSSAAATFSAALVNLPQDVYADPSGFVWEFPDSASEFADFNIFGGGSFGTGNSVWLSGKKSGSFAASVGHPLALNKRTFYVVVKNIDAEAVDASTYITTSQNYVLASAGADPVTIGVTIYNLGGGEENALLWSAEHSPKDGSGSPVIEYAAATGSYASRSPRSASIPIASGELTVRPVREGSAVISVSHPKAFYDTKILVTVLPAGSGLDEKPFFLSAEDMHLTIINGESADIIVSLEGESARAPDEADIAWNSSDPSRLAASASGAHARLSAVGQGFSLNTVTVTHPKALTPLIITVACGDDARQADSAKYVFSSNYSYIVEENQTIYVPAFINNEEEGDSLIWAVASGLDSVISIAQIGPRLISVTGLKNGLASVTASVANSPGPGTPASFQILVSSKAAPPSRAAYLSTSDNVVLLGLEEEKTIAVTPVNIPFDNLISWSGYDSSLIDLIPNNYSAVVRPKGKTGSTSISVSHPNSANALAVNVRVGSRYIYENTNIAYISAPDTVALTAGGYDHQLQVLLANTETPDTSNTGFSFSNSKPSVASVDHYPGSNTAFIKPLAAGQSVLTARHPDAPDKDILIVVERAAGDSPLTPYITSKQNIAAVISGSTATVSASLVNALSYNNSEWRWSAGPNPSVSIVASNGPTAIIRGYNPGQAVLSVSHEKAPHPLAVTVLCADSAVAASRPWIKTNFSILSLKAGSSETITAEMVGGSGADSSSFVFSASSQAVVFMSQASNSAYVRGLTPGTAVITVTNAMYPITDPGNKKTVLVIVEPAAGGDAYIAADKNAVHMSPESAAPAVINASLSGTGVSASDQRYFTWWADDYSIVHLNSVAHSASVMPTGKTGVTAIHVTHPKSAYPLDIIVSVGRYTQFAFAEQSKSVPKGGAAFIPMRVPPQSGSFKIEYSSSNPAVCEIVGSNSTAMIAGISNGQAAVSASLIADGQAVASAELSVIVGYVSPNSNALAVSSSIVNLEIGRQHTLKALLSGPDISEQDKFNILWKSDDPSVASLLATENGLTKGPEALVTATGPGETFIAVSHSKVKYDLSPLHPQPEQIVEGILIVVPEQNQKIISLSRTSIAMYKDDPDVKITAAILNGSQQDYSSISWSAARSSGQNIVSIRGSGKDCNIHPLNVGTATLRAQLPNGIYADCIVSVQASSGISFSSNAVRLNPGYSETVGYSVSPDSALIQWNSAVGGLVSPDEYFSFDVDTAAKTVTVNARKIGSGYIQGIMLSGGSGGPSNFTARLNVFVEYSYSFDLDIPAVISREPLPGTVIEIPYRCYPSDLKVELEPVSAENGKAVRLYSVSHDSSAGTGVIRLEALAEKENITLYAKAGNPNDPSMNPITRPITLRLVYDDIALTPVFYTNTGSFSGFQKIANGAWNLALGDGEDVLFYLDLDQKNADIDVDNISISYLSKNPKHKDGHNVPESDVSFKRQENGREVVGGFVKAGYDLDAAPENGQRLFRISHTKDVVRKDEGYLITKDRCRANSSN